MQELLKFLNTSFDDGYLSKSERKAIRAIIEDKSPSKRELAWLRSQLFDFAIAGQSGSGKTISSVLLCRFFRQAAASNNYADKIAVLYIDAHYQVDSFGSDAIDGKT